MNHSFKHMDMDTLRGTARAYWHRVEEVVGRGEAEWLEGLLLNGWEAGTRAEYIDFIRAAKRSLTGGWLTARLWDD